MNKFKYIPLTKEDILRGLKKAKKFAREIKKLDKFIDDKL